MHRQLPCRPFGAQINPRGDPLVVQKRQHVIAVNPLGLRCVDFQAIAEIEQALSAAALPDQRIERRQQRTGNDLARHFGLRQAIGDLPPVGDFTHLQLTSFNQLSQTRPSIRRAQAKVITQVFFRTNAQCLRRMQQQTALRLGLVRRGLLQDRSRNHPLGQIVQALETASPRHCDLTGGEQPFQRMFLGTPVPPWPGLVFAGRQTAGTQRAPLLNRSQHAANGFLLFATKPRQLLIDVFATLGPLHTPAQQRVHRQRQQRRFMAPVFEQRAPTPRTPGSLVEQVRGVGTETGKQRQVVRAHHGIDGIDLQQAQPFDQPVEMTGIDGRRLAPVEPLGSQRQTSRLFEGKGHCRGHLFLHVCSQPTSPERGLCSDSLIIYASGRPRTAARFRVRHRRG